MNKTQKEIQRQINYNYVNKYLDSMALQLIKKRTPELVSEVNTKVLKIIEKDPSILTITDHKGRNLGMRCTTLQLEEVVLRALDDPIASTQQDTDGYNIGQNAAVYGLNRAASKALDNPIACLQQDNGGFNLVMRIAKHLTTDTELVNKALSNEEACKSVNGYGRNAKETYELALNKLKEDEEFEALAKDQNQTEIKVENKTVENEDNRAIAHTKALYYKAMNIIESYGEYYYSCIKNVAILDEKKLQNAEEEVLNLIEEEPSILTISDDEGYNIGMYATINNMLAITSRALDDKVASTQQNIHGRNIGMMCATKENRELTLKALDNEEASIQQDENGYNIGMCSAQAKMEDCVIKALENPQASLQQNNSGLTIGMLSFCNKMKEAELIALSNIESRKLHNNEGWTIETYYMKERICETLLDAEQVLMENNGTCEEVSQFLTREIYSAIDSVLKNTYNKKEVNEDLDNCHDLYVDARERHDLEELPNEDTNFIDNSPVAEN